MPPDTKDPVETLRKEVTVRLDGLDRRLDRTDEEIAHMAKRMGSLVTESTAQMLLTAFDGMSKRLTETASKLVIHEQCQEERDKHLDAFLIKLEKLEQLFK